MTFFEFTDFVNGFTGKRPEHMRLGQWAFNLLFDAYPELAKEIQGTDVDPFYNNDKVPAFLQHLLSKITMDPGV